METMLVRLKPYDPRRGNVLRRFTYRGIKFHQERGWYRVEKAVAEHLRSIHQVPAAPLSPLAFDVCSDDEAKTLDAKEKDSATARKAADDEIKLSAARQPTAPTADATDPKDDKKAKKDR
jgi:hypothetical protein